MNKEKNGCLSIIAIVAILLFVLLGIDWCHKDTYEISSWEVDCIVINTTTDLANIYYKDGKVIHIDMDKTLVRVDSTDRKIIVGLKEYDF